MTTLPRSQRLPSLFAGSVIVVLGIGLLLNIINWLLYGLDIPYWDDWRPYLQGEAGDLSLSTLFKPANDTLYPVGLALDALAQRFLRGNSLVYQFVSMTVVLGGILLLQWRLLSRVLSDRVLVACAASTLLLMLQPGSYWGLQNMAYHQALPLLALLFALDVIYCQPWRRLVSPLLVLVVGLLAGMTYISGAFAILSAGIGLFIASRIGREPRTHVVAGAAALTMAGLATSIPQGWVIAFHQRGTHRADAPMALPTDADFWMFLLGKIGRSLLLPTHYPLLALAVVVLLLALLVASGIWLGCAARAASDDAAPGPTSAGLRDQFGIYFALAAAIACYLFLVSAGRANLRDPAIVEPLQVFLHGFPRFHFFWLTALWPWLVAALLACLKPRGTARGVAVVVGLAIMAVCIFNGAYRHSAYFQEIAQPRAEGIRCLEDRLNAREPLTCGTLYPSTDLSQAIRFANSMGSTFSRSLPIESIVEIGFEPGPPVPLLLNEGDRFIASFDLSEPALVSRVGVFIGTHNGASDGNLTVELCQRGKCQAGAGGIDQAADNDFMEVDLSAPLNIFLGSPVTLRLTTSGTTFPLAIWAYRAPDGAAGTQMVVRRSGAREAQPGLSPRVRLVLEQLPLNSH